MTIKDVAKKAGVSISTASYALNDKPYVHPDTKMRVLKAAEELNYYPNAHARSLKMKKNNNIGVFIYGLGGPIYSDLLEGVRIELQKRGYNIIVSSGKSSSVFLRERATGAAVIFDTEISNDEVLRYAKTHPIVVLDRKINGKNIYQSIIENKKLVYDFISEIIKQKQYKKISYLSGPEDSYYSNERYLGFKEALKDNNILEHEYINCDFTITSGYKLGVKLVKENKVPDLLYCANDEMAIGVMKAFTEMGIKVPEDCNVAGFDGIILGDYITPKLTTISVDYFEWGRQIAGFLTKKLDNLTVYPLRNPEAKVVFKESLLNGSN